MKINNMLTPTFFVNLGSHRALRNLFNLFIFHSNRKESQNAYKLINMEKKMILYASKRILQEN